MTEESEYDKIVKWRKAQQPAKCNGCRYEDTNGSRPGAPKNRICCECPYG